MRALVPLFILISGCYVGPVYNLKDKRSACAAAIVEMGHDLAIKVDNGVGDGAFDYDVLGWSLIDHTEGSYDLDTGEFWWLNTFADSSVRAFERVEGTGLIENNGNMDLEYVETVTMQDGNQEQYNVRHVRTGCLDTLRRERVDDNDDVVLVDGSWGSAGYTWLRNFVEGPAPVIGEGVMFEDRSWEEYVDFAQGGIQVKWSTTGDGNGHRTRQFDDDNGFERTEGVWERWFDGTVNMSFSRNNAQIDKQDWDFTVDSVGDGSGTWTTAEDTCDLSFKAGKCKLKNCSSEFLDGDCQVPVTWPDF